MCPLPMTSFSEIPHERHRGPQPAVRLDQQDARVRPGRKDLALRRAPASFLRQNSDAPPVRPQQVTGPVIDPVIGPDSGSSSSSC